MKRYICLILGLVIILSLVTACMKDNVNILNDNKVKGTKSYDVIDANSEFAFDIFKLLNKEDADKNIFISPLSISAALSMTLNGAAEGTREDMKKALAYNNISIEDINEGNRYLIDKLTSIDKKVTLDIGNSIWVKEGFKVKQPFIDINREAYNAKVSNLDFTKDKSVDVINGWIDKSTNGMIPKMLKPPIPGNVVMYLINAIYFKGEWTNSFDDENTFDTKFNTKDGGKKDIEMMSKKAKIDYYKNDSIKAVRLPYGNGKVSMYCILPENNDIDKLIEDFNVTMWNDIESGLKPEEDLILQIPKFKMEYGIKKLNDALIDLGMGVAFSDQADFTNITDKNIAISRVLHKAIIEVNEQGTKAAGATVVEMVESAVMQPAKFIANRPFLFIIADNEDGNILFLGKMIK